MHPMYRFMESHPQQRNQAPYNPHYYPQFKSNPHYMKIDPSRSSVAYDSWPCGGNYGYPYPPQFHNCCIHNNSPSHCSFRPPYIPPPSYSSGNYPAYPGIYPAHYVPPPHFTMEQPRYEYDKNVDRDYHCCGCPNHSCNEKGWSNVKIEEQDQDKKNESNESVVPFGFKNSPFPVVWLPPDYMKNSECMKPTGSKGKEQEEDSQVLKPYGNFRSFEQPTVWNMWPPYHRNNSESPKQRGDSTRKQQDDLNKKQFPFPIFWMPYKPEETEGKISKETDSGNNVEQEPTTPSKSTIPRLHDAKDERSNSRENEVKSGIETRKKGLKKDFVMKTIPVKQVEQNEKILDERREDASERHDGDMTEKKVIQVGGEKQASSPRKSSKLPPVCLRVDPLPRKRSGNGSSRSPSPPGGKGKLVESHNDSSRSPIISNEEEKLVSLVTGVPEKSIEVEPSKSNTKVVEVARGTSKDDKLQNKCTVFPDLRGHERGQTGEVDTNKADNKSKIQPDRLAAEAKSSKEGHQSDEAREAELVKADADGDMKKDTRRELSDDKAATIIQSAYRGFSVRRWEPLNKLKQIVKIKEQITELKTCIEAFESSAEDVVDHKRRTIVTESIMGLLLKLDTIQGLHPMVRESRKSVVKDLVSLQEKLDVLNCKKQPASSEDTSGTMEDNVSLQGGLEVQKLEQDGNLVKGDEGTKFDTKKPCEEQPLAATEILSSCHPVANAEVLAGKEENNTVEEVMVDEASNLPSESKENGDHMLLDENAVLVVKSEEHDKADQSFPNPIPFPEELIASSGSKVRGCGLKVESEVVNELEELPRGVSDQETSGEVSTEIRKGEVLQYYKGEVTANIPEGIISDAERVERNHLEPMAEKPVVLRLENRQENTHPGNGQEENSEVLERDVAVLVDDVENDRKVARPLNEDVKSSGLNDKVGKDKNGDELGQYSTTSPAFLLQPPEEAITIEQSTYIINRKESETVEVPQEKMHNVVDGDILDSEKTIEQSEPQLSTVTDDGVEEYHVPDKQKVCEGNMAAQGEESLNHNDAIVSVPDDEGKEHNVEVEKRLREGNCEFEMQDEEPVAADNTAPENKEPVNRYGTLAASTPEAATIETEPSEDKVLNVEEDQSFGSVPTEVRVIDTKEHKEWKKVDMSPSSPTASQVSFVSDAFSESDRKLIEENEKLRETMEKLIEAGKEQLTAISSLSGRVKDLEKRLSRKKKLKLKRSRVAATGSACVKPCNDPLKESAMGLAM